MHEYQRAQAVFAFGWRPVATLALDASLGVRYVEEREKAVIGEMRGSEREGE